VITIDFIRRENGVPYQLDWTGLDVGEDIEVGDIVTKGDIIGDICGQAIANNNIIYICIVISVGKRTWLAALP
jgi:hypothetical protein